MKSHFHSLILLYQTLFSFFKIIFHVFIYLFLKVNLISNDYFFYTRLDFSLGFCAFRNQKLQEISLKSFFYFNHCAFCYLSDGG